MSPRKVSHRRRWFTPSRVIALGFLVIILLGGLLLSLPISSRDGSFTPFIESLMTATSATCVTGLVAYDTYTHWSLFGQMVILVLIQVGGLGFVTIAILINMLRGSKIGLRQRFLMQESVGLPQIAGILRATSFILRCAALFEGIGALLLATQFVPRYGLLRGVWFSIFHSISAFCNAGFDLMGRDVPYSSLTDFVANPLVNLTIMALIIIGGLGFAVWTDVYERRTRLHTYRLQTKLVLSTTAILLVFPFLFFLLYEFQLPQWMGMSIGDKIWASLFQSVTPRTAGFNTVDYATFSGTSLMLTIVLMLIGGSPGSTAGGVKTTTVAAIFLSIRSVLRRKPDTEAFGRRLDEEVLGRATVLVFLYLVLFLAGGAALSMLEAIPLNQALFECASAIGTVGLSLGLTPTLSAPSHLILTFLMYFGRVGGLTMIYALANPNETSPRRLPVERVIIG